MSEHNDDLAAIDSDIEVRHEPSSRLRAFMSDPLWYFLLIGILVTAGGLIGLFLSLSRVRPESAVFRQIPYLVSAIAFGTLVIAGFLTCVCFFLWRVFGQIRRLLMELEEAAAALMWERVIRSEDERPAERNGDRAEEHVTVGRRPVRKR
jgi:hypothetical protein